MWFFCVVFFLFCFILNPETGLKVISSMNHSISVKRSVGGASCNRTVILLFRQALTSKCVSLQLYTKNTVVMFLRLNKHKRNTLCSYALVLGLLVKL